MSRENSAKEGESSDITDPEVDIVTTEDIEVSQNEDVVNEPVEESEKPECMLLK